LPAPLDLRVFPNLRIDYLESITMKNILTKVLLVSGLMLCGSASAQYYVGGTAGKSKWSVDANPAATSVKKTDNAYHVIAGYSVNDITSIELSYLSLGKNAVTTTTGSTGVKAKAAAASTVFKTDAWKGLSGFGKLGVAYVKGEPYSTPTSTGISASSTSTQLLFGLGATYQLPKKWSLRAEYERMDVETKKSTTIFDTNRVWNFGIGVQKAF
jgi:OmpA-OmpF porin, OOP family